MEAAPQKESTIKELQRPFPALTPSQRYHFEAFGYVIVPGVLSAEECETINDALHKIQRDVQDPEYSARRQPHQPFALINAPHHTYMGGILEADPAITAFATHPRLIGMAEEIVGGEARIVEFNAHINSRDPQLDLSKPPTYALHNGMDVPFGSHYKNDLYHCNFVKTLTTLVDLGPEDGGTVLIPGSHKVAAPQADIINAAYADPNLIHQLIAPAGSTLIFSETTIHATGQLRSEKERAIIIAGYAASMFPYWDGGEMSDEFRNSIPDNLKTFLLGKAHWTRGPRYRTLADSIDARTFTIADGWRPNKGH
jgi:ectoine hydroxylase-related dioxygenase (phytanoyl-CoA dioxygenase family)